MKQAVVRSFKLDRDIKALIGGIDSEGVSEAELDAVADRIIAAVPNAVLARLKAKL
jgi:hypothetical protein